MSTHPQWNAIDRAAYTGGTSTFIRVHSFDGPSGRIIGIALPLVSKCAFPGADLNGAVGGGRRFAETIYQMLASWGVLSDVTLTVTQRTKENIRSIRAIRLIKRGGENFIRLDGAIYRAVGEADLEHLRDRNILDDVKGSIIVRVHMHYVELIAEFRKDPSSPVTPGPIQNLVDVMEFTDDL